MEMDGVGGVLTFSDQALRAADNVSLAGSACHGAFDRLIVKATAPLRAIITGETLPPGSAEQFMAEIRREERWFGHEMRDVARFNFCKLLAGVIDKHEQPADIAPRGGNENESPSLPDESSTFRDSPPERKPPHFLFRNAPPPMKTEDEADQTSFSGIQGSANFDPNPQPSPPQVATQDDRMNEDVAAVAAMARDAPQTSAAAVTMLKLFDCKQPRCGFISTSFEGLCQHSESVHPLAAEELFLAHMSQGTSMNARGTETTTTLPSRRSSLIRWSAYSVTTPEGMHLCPFPACKTTFTLSSSIGRHVRTCHMNERNYGCHLCEKRFSGSSDRKKHVEKVHGGGATASTATTKR